MAEKDSFWQSFLAALGLSILLFFMPILGRSKPLLQSAASSQASRDFENEALVSFVLLDGSTIPENAIAVPDALSRILADVVNHEKIPEAKLLIKHGDTLILTENQTTSFRVFPGAR